MLLCLHPTVRRRCWWGDSPWATRSVPSIDTRELSTSVLVNNGETVVLGGIFQDSTARNEDKVPYLSSIPGVGALFRRRANETQKRELLIFVSPTIVEDRPPVN